MMHTSNFTSEGALLILFLENSRVTQKKLVVYCCYLFIDKQDHAEPRSNGFKTIPHITSKSDDDFGPYCMIGSVSTITVKIRVI